MVTFHRHDMLKIGDAGREHALAAAAWYNPPVKETFLYYVLFPNTPAIVKAQGNLRNNFLEVGFSSHLLKDGIRMRFKSEIPIDDVKDVITPFDLMERAGDCRHKHIRNSLEELARLAGKCGLDAGVYGSCALELLTQMPYIMPTSDIDIILKCRDTNADISRFYDSANRISQYHGTRVDIEIVSSDGAGIKLAELLSNQKTVMCKGMYGLELKLKQNIVFA
ncbi:MAG: malonate decarboxylase holo-[acyl-carrier-protein] synthase [Treponema sp.]|nr:malonate decarboxylase holo-[acyl-carrier-protein] synthase [Treponema sp.]